MSVHSLLSGDELHDPYHFVQESDPGAVGSGKYWLKVSTGAVKRRNAANSDWGNVGISDITTTKGDILARGAAGIERLPIGADTFVLTADASEALGMKWAAGGGGGGGGGYVVTPPTANNSTGTAGTYALDTNFAYFCIATNTWLKTSLRQVKGVFTWVSNGDTNGYLYFRGRRDGSFTWGNPMSLGEVEVVCSAVGSGVGNETLVNRADDNWLTTNVANSYVGVDFGAGHALKINGYTLKSRGSFGTEAIRNWKLQGTNTVAGNTATGWNAATWTDLDTQVANTSMTSAAQWIHLTLTLTATAYRYMRILQTGVNSSGTDYLCLGEFEFYGAE